MDKNYKEILPKDIGIRKKIKIFFLDDSLIFKISQKSRILLKDTAVMEDILLKVQNYTDQIFKKKIIFIDAPLCSKAKKEFENLNWDIKI